MLTYSITPIK